MADNFLEPADDTAVPLLDQEEQLPGLAALKRKFEDSETEGIRMNNDGCKHTRTSVASMTRLRSTVTLTIKGVHQDHQN